jgi:hypothetical protein
VTSPHTPGWECGLGVQPAAGGHGYWPVAHAKAATFLRELGPGIAGAARPGAELLLLSVTTAPLGWHVAEAMGIPEHHQTQAFESQLLAGSPSELHHLG